MDNNLPYTEDRLVQYVNSMFDSAEEGVDRQRFMRNFDKYTRAYEGRFKTKLSKQYSQFFVNMSFQTVDTVMAYFYESMFNNYPIATYVGRMSEDMEKAKTIQYAMDYEIYKRNFIDRSITALNWVLMYGTGVTKDYWRYEVGNRKVRKKQEVFPGVNVTSVVNQPYLKYDNPSFQIIDPRNFYADPNAGTVEADNGFGSQVSFAGHEEYVDFEALVRDSKVKEYFNLDKIAGTNAAPPEHSGALTNSEREFDGRKRQRVKLREYWGTISRSKNTPYNNLVNTVDNTIYKVIIANDTTLISFEEMPYYHGEIPYNVSNIYKTNDSIYGMSLIETVLTDNNILNVLTNLRLMNVQNLVNPTPTVYRNALEDRDHFEKKRPGPAYIKFPEDQGKVVNYPSQYDIGGSAYNQMTKDIRTNAMLSSGVNPERMGMYPSTKQSATATATVSSSATARFKKMNFVYSNTWMRPTLQRWVQLLQQYSTSKRLGTVMGDRDGKYIEYSPDEIQGEFDVEVMDATVSNKDIVAQTYINLLGSLAPYFQSGQLDARPVLEEILNEMPLIRNADKILDKAFTLNQEEVQAIRQLAPGVLDAIQQARQQQQGINKGTQGTGQNGGRVNNAPQVGGTGNVHIGG